MNNHLKNNNYPGRGIIIGKTMDSTKIIQIYWIMGRSENSRNRIFKVEENNFVKTEVFDKTKVIDPSLIIYYPVKDINNYHIVTNGNQTDTIYDFINDNKSFENAINEQLYEPDKPNFTPRISVLVNVKKGMFKLAIVKTINHDENYFIREVFSYNDLIKGKGYCITTYEKDGNPLPCFEGEPRSVNIYDSIEENIDRYWDLLDKENRVSLLVKSINIKNDSVEIKIKNKNQ